MITGAQMRAARALVRWSADDLATHSRLGVATVRRAEAVDGVPSITAANADAIRRALEAAGVEFIPQNGGGAGVRTRISAVIERCISDLLALLRSEGPFEAKLDDLMIGHADHRGVIGTEFSRRAWGDENNAPTERGSQMHDRIVFGRPSGELS